MNRTALKQILAQEGMVREAAWPGDPSSFMDEVEKLRARVQSMANSAPFRSTSVHRAFRKLESAFDDLDQALDDEMSLEHMWTDRRDRWASDKNAAVKMQGIKTHRARNATQMMTVTVQPDGTLAITAKRDQIDPDLHPEYMKNQIRNQARNMKKLANMYRRFGGFEPGSVAQVGRWNSQEPWSDNSGYIIVTSDRDLGEALADVLPKVFPKDNRSTGWVSKGQGGEWVWENFNYYIGD